MSTQTETVAAQHPGGTILFVDDEPLSLKYFKASVGKYAKVVTADTTEAALKILESEGDAISVVVSDERMPRDSGVSFLSDVRKSWPSTVRILTSAYANIDLQQAINGAAIHRFVPKPWNLDELCEAMKEALQAERAQEAQSFHPTGPGEAECASIELLAVLTRELVQPLQTLERDALALKMNGRASLTPAPHGQSQSETWSAQLRAGKIAAAADRIHRNVSYCRELAEPIAALAVSLCEPAAALTYSMAETASEVLDKVAQASPRKFIALDASDDFEYRAPKQIIVLVLTTVLQRAVERAYGTHSDITVELRSSTGYNDVVVTSAAPEGEKFSASSDSGRVARSALWAFGGELLHSHNIAAATETTCLRLPKAARDPARPSH
jgi:two-component system probable response regulator PhcQ